MDLKNYCMKYGGGSKDDDIITYLLSEGDKKRVFLGEARKKIEHKEF